MKTADEKHSYRICIWCGERWNVSVKYPMEWDYICPVCKDGYNWLKKCCKRCEKNGYTANKSNKHNRNS